MSGGPGYSEADLAADLRDWWNDQVATDRDPFADPLPPKAGTIFEVVPVVDSLAVVTALVTMEKHVGFKVPPSVIRAVGIGVQWTCLVICCRRSGRWPR